MKYIDSVENNPKYALDKDNDPTLNGVKLSVIMAEMKKNEPVAGSKDGYEQKYLDTRKNIEEQIESEQNTLGGRLNPKRIEEIINDNIETIVKDPTAHWLYKNKIQGNSEYGDTANTNYIGGGIAEGEAMTKFETQRDDILKNYLKNDLSKKIINKAPSLTTVLGNELKQEQLKKIKN